MEDLNCPVCYSMYSTEKEPIIIPICGHTICKTCLFTLELSDFKCPIDRRSLYEISRKIALDDWPRNYTVLNLLDRKKPKKINFSFELCDIHKIDKKFICMTCDGVLVCFKCALYNGHNNHQIEQVKDCFKQKLKDIEKLKEDYLIIKDKQEIFDEKLKNVKTKLVRKNKSMLDKKIDKFFDEVSLQINDEIELKRNITKKIIEKKINHSIENVEKNFGYFNQSSQLKDVEENITSIEKELKHNEKTSSELLSQLDHSLLKIKGKLVKLEQRTSIESLNELEIEKHGIVDYNFKFDSKELPEAIDNLIIIGKAKKRDKRRHGSIKPVLSNGNLMVNKFKTKPHYHSYVKLNNLVSDDLFPQNYLKFMRNKSKDLISESRLSFVSIPNSLGNINESDESLISR